jgi:hypothetical protein
VRQFAYVVNDVDATLAAWLELGVGPWFVLRRFHAAGLEYRDQQSAPTITMALANSGDMQIEVIGVHDEAPSVWKEFLDSGREGFHHIAYWSRDYAAEYHRAVELGWTCAQRGPQPFAYFETSGSLQGMVELMELSERLEGYTDAVREAAADWDGVTDPIRPYPPTA